MTATDQRSFYLLVCDLVACALIEGHAPTEHAKYTTKAAKRKVLEAFDSDQKATPGAAVTGEGSVGLSAEPSRPPELPSNQKAWDVLSDVEKARRYAAEYRANPDKRADAIHTHWLMVLDDEIERLSQANKAHFDVTMDNGQMAREIAQLRKGYARLINTSKTGGSDTCITCAAHVLVITEDLEPEIARLRNGLRRLAGDLSDGPTRRIAQAILDGSTGEDAT